MILDEREIAGIVAGSIDRVFRVWKKPSAKAGSQMRSGDAVVAIGAVDVLARDAVTADDARHAGFESVAALVASLWTGEGDLYRIAVSYAGPDPRIALRARLPDAAEIAAIIARLQKLERSRPAPWTAATLRLIADHPAKLAARLAKMQGRETAPFKIDVRKLKELGLTESLEIGYRLSARGEVVLAELERLAGA